MSPAAPLDQPARPGLALLGFGSFKTDGGFSTIPREPAWFPFQGPLRNWGALVGLPSFLPMGGGGLGCSEAHFFPLPKGGSFSRVCTLSSLHFAFVFVFSSRQFSPAGHICRQRRHRGLCEEQPSQHRHSPTKRPPLAGGSPKKSNRPSGRPAQPAEAP